MTQREYIANPEESVETAQELVDWVRSLDEPLQSKIIAGLEEGQDRGCDIYRMLYNIREEYNARQNPGLLDIFMAFMKGRAEAAWLVHGPAALRNLANGGK